MIAPEEYAGGVRDFVKTNFMFGIGEGLNDSDSFLGKNIIDSTGILELVMFLENTYGIKVATADMVPENLDSISRVARFVEKKVLEKLGNQSNP